MVPSNPQDPQETSHSEQGISEVLLWGLKPLHRASFKPLWAGRNMARGHSWCGLVVQSPLTAWQLGSNKVPGMGWCQDHRAACPGTPRAPSTATAQPSPVVPTETSVPGRDLPADPICCGCEPDHNRVRCSRSSLQMHRPAAKPLPCLRRVGFYTSRHFRGNFDLQVLLLQTALTLLSLFFFYL